MGPIYTGTGRGAGHIVDVKIPRTRTLPLKHTGGSSESLSRVPIQVPIVRTVSFWGPFFGHLLYGNYHMFQEPCLFIVKPAGAKEKDGVLLESQNVLGLRV